MQTATMGSVFALLALSSYPVLAGDWDSLGRFSKLRTVTVHLKDGQKMKGTIQQVEPGSLQLAPSSSVNVRTEELVGTVDKARVGQIVELNTRGGQSFKGTLREANQYYVRLDETKGFVRISRGEIQRITYRSGGLGALLGLAAGGGGGFALGASQKSSHGEASVGGGILGGLAGTAVGAMIGVERSVYKMPAPAPNPPR